jgi:hypothetical protein
MKTTTKPATTTPAAAPYRFTFDMAQIATSGYGNPLPSLTLTGPTGDWRAVRAAALRAMADAEELLIGVAGAQLRLEASDRGATITAEADGMKEASTVREALAMAGRIATGHAGWATRTDGARVVVSVPR